MSKTFAGASKTNTSFISPIERRMERIVIPLVPARIETYHLTLFTLVWCMGIIAFSLLAAARDIRWLWLVSLMVVLQYVTDYLDGKVGKYRNTGLVKWGFYFDHLLDYVFLCAVAVGYAIILPESLSRYHLLLVLTVFGGFMVNSFLTFAVTQEFDISYMKFGPTEFRIALVIINTLLIFYGTGGMIKALPFVAAGGFISLCSLIYRTQKAIWENDMIHKKRYEAHEAQEQPPTRVRLMNHTTR